MNDVPFSVKYRPKKLADLIGQDVVTKILTNSFLQKRLHHAYLFEGTFGVGKTSCSRVLAAMENCEQGRTLEPCGTCSNCQEIFTGKSLDVREIDAASNRGIDDIRDLQNDIAYCPISCRVKYVILDEASSLSGFAAEAALKMIEEPPPGVRFILSTTESQQLKPTIHSRCISLNFRKINWLDLYHHLKSIVEKESINCEDAVLKIIAQSSNGSARDSLQHLQSLVGYAGDKEIVADDAQKVLGFIDENIYFELLDKMVSVDVPGSMLVINNLIEKGRNSEDILKGLEQHLRNLMICKLCTDDISAFGISDYQAKRYAHQAQSVRPKLAARMLSFLLEVKQAIMLNMDLQSFLIKFVIDSIIVMRKISSS